MRNSGRQARCALYGSQRKCLCSFVKSCQVRQDAKVDAICPPGAALWGVFRLASLLWSIEQVVIFKPSHHFCSSNEDAKDAPATCDYEPLSLYNIKIKKRRLPVTALHKSSTCTVSLDVPIHAHSHVAKSFEMELLVRQSLLRRYRGLKLAWIYLTVILCRMVYLKYKNFISSSAGVEWFFLGNPGLSSPRCFYKGVVPFRLLDHCLIGWRTCDCVRCRVQRHSDYAEHWR